MPLQRARLLKEGMKKFYRGDSAVIAQVEHAYEQAIESIEYDYRYLAGTPAHASLLMFFGVFLCTDLHQYGRAIRFLEDSKEYNGTTNNKAWFVIRNYLSKAYEVKYNKSKDDAYKHQLSRLVREVILNEKELKKIGIYISQYKNNYSKWV